MGVSGSGKSTVSESLAARLGWVYEDGDRFHPASNVAKMSAGHPLTDEDRWPWLDIIGNELRKARTAGEDIVVTCSSLKKIYRDKLRSAGGEPLYFVFLKGTPELLAERMGARKGHFMPSALLQSQLATLETPEGEAHVVTVDIDASLDDIVTNAIAKLEELWR
jgi:gluconokinase